MTTMRDVARVAGVSAKTVSRVFNDDPHVAEETRDTVLALTPATRATSRMVVMVGLRVPPVGQQMVQRVDQQLVL